MSGTPPPVLGSVPAIPTSFKLDITKLAACSGEIVGFPDELATAANTPATMGLENEVPLTRAALSPG